MSRKVFICLVSVFSLLLCFVGCGSKDASMEEETSVSEETVKESSALTIEFDNVELGEYGQRLVLNEGTEFEDNVIGYFVPAGKYKVTNAGPTMTQVNVYKNEKNVTEEGWEEWADGNVELIDVDQTKEMIIDEGYFFNVDGTPQHIILEKIE